MKLTLKRIAKKTTYTIGKLYIDGQYFCDTLEDKDRGLDQKMTLDEIKKKKVHGQTAIPIGTYKVTLDVISPKFGGRVFYKQFANGGRVPRILNIPGFDGVLLHVGNLPSQTDGCVLVGRNTKVGMVLNSKETFINLYKELLKDKNNITLTIQ